MENKLLKEARDLLVMCTLIDKSGQCKEMVNKIDNHYATKEEKTNS